MGSTLEHNYIIFVVIVGMHSRGERIKYLGHWHVSPQSLQEMMRLECSPSTYWIRSNGVRFLDNSLTLEYAGEGGNIQDCALAQANFPISVTNHYFEIEIIDGGAGCSIAIGLAKLTYPLHRHPGWNAGAIGYHADDGMLFQERGVGRDYGPTCAAGDVMGCGVRFSSTVGVEPEEDLGSESDASIPEEALLCYRRDVYDEHGLLNYNSDSDEDSDFEGDPYLRMDFQQQPQGQQEAKPKKPQEGKVEKAPKRVTVYFTRNGEHLEDVECDLPSGGFYPTVAMLSKGEKIKVNLYPLSG